MVNMAKNSTTLHAQDVEDRAWNNGSYPRGVRLPSINDNGPRTPLLEWERTYGVVTVELRGAR